MKKLIEWLMGIEQLARNLYADAAVIPGADKSFTAFLTTLAGDEERHRTVMEQAAEHLRMSPESDRRADITLDETVRQRVELPFFEAGKKLRGGSLSMEAMIDAVIESEYSEWNDIFLYVVNTLKDAGREFQLAASRMERHKHHIEDYLSGIPGGSVYIDRIRSLTSVWKEHILIADDSEAVVRFLTAVCSRFGSVDTAGNGREALQKTGSRYYDLVISDIDMPAMDGIRFFEEAEKSDPAIGERFLFFSGNIEEEHLEYFRRRGLRFLAKPAAATDIQNTIAGILR